MPSGTTYDLARGREAPARSRREGDRTPRRLPRPRPRRSGRGRTAAASSSSRRPSGGAYSGGYGGFTNYVHPDVQAYNVDLAVAAAKLGVDDILYDYVRRPDGPLGSMVVPGPRGRSGGRDRRLPRERAARSSLHTSTFLGASVFGIAATRPDEIAQDVPAIAREVDYIAPMLYPSHWGPNEYGVGDPERQPYAIVRRSLLDFNRAVRGSGARVVPWLQDFSLGVEYGRARGRAQIDATLAAGIDEYLLWDPTVTYASGALTQKCCAADRGLAHCLVTGFSAARAAPADLGRPRIPCAAASSPTSSASSPCSCTTGCCPTVAATTTSRPTSSAPSSRGSTGTTTGR